MHALAQYPSIFITGTDTDVGKTVTTGYLAKQLLDSGKTVSTQKWVQCGNLDHLDISTHQEWCNPTQIHHLDPSVHCPYRFQTPVSPHLASALDNTRIDPQVIASAYHAMRTHYDITLIEGAGGLMVPLSDDLLLIDLVQQLQIPTVLVVENKVGCINHSLLSLEALHKRNINCIGLIMNTRSKDIPKAAEKDNARIIERVGGIKVIDYLSYIP